MQTNQGDFRNRHAEYVRLDRAMTELRQQMRLTAEAMLNELQANGVTQRRVARRCKAPESMISNIRCPYVCSASSLPRFYLGIFKMWQEVVQ